MHRQFSRWLAVASLFLVSTCGSSQETRESVYFVGNSLTWDSLNSAGLNSLASRSGVPFNSSQHIRCGSSLTGTTGDASGAGTCAPTGFGDPDLGPYPSAFRSRIDTLVVQPFYGASLREEIDAIESLIGEVRSHTVNSDTRLLLYSTWGYNRTDGDFTRTWNTHAADLDAPFIPSRSTYDLILSELALSDHLVEMIPSGQAVADAAELLSARNFGSLKTEGDLYRDDIHLSNAGRYLAAITTLSTVTGISPIELGDHDIPFQFSLPGYGTAPDAVAASQLRGIAASAINATAVPEPGMAVACACVALVAFIRRRVAKNWGVLTSWPFV